ncbi:MAG: hypothetical protein Q8P72_05355 [Candidatus Roizmanbacteria bacterium]|nr:hypothetical protein [Candidatus Roizmanbacteria bacterium]
MDTLQVKLSMDEGLRNVWGNLQNRYKALGKSGIIRLALNNLSEKLEKNKYDYLLEDVLEDIDSRKEGYTEEEFADWWNKNKNTLDE